jgi:hypothetical protein
MFAKLYEHYVLETNPVLEISILYDQQHEHDSRANLLCDSNTSYRLMRREFYFLHESGFLKRIKVFILTNITAYTCKL